MIRPTSLTDEQAQRVRQAIQRLVEQYGSQSELQRSTGLPQRTVSKVIRAGNPERPGAALAAQVARVMGISYTQLVDGKSDVDEMRASPELRFLPNWESAAAEALARYPRLDQTIVKTVGEIQARKPPTRITPEFIMNLAMAWEIGMANVKDETAEAKHELEIQRRHRRKG